ncbi:hypothetical protein ACFVUS_27965 [Nocardia sp. NPDC058058]|uniref:hypothetical protein n=1 Tax=Nocardia sp. NPDC058058 TaxID=3346317 RepID=UPI0036DE91C7
MHLDGAFRNLGCEVQGEGNKKRHSIFGFGISIAAAGALLNPMHAAAQEFAPGVTCEGRICTNDTDDQYVVLWEVTCMNVVLPPGETVSTVTTTTGHFSQTVAPRSTLSVDTDCPQGTTLSYWITGVQPG